MCRVHLPGELTRLSVVSPDQCRASRPSEELVIARGAFGSGEHETTWSCLRLLEEMDLSTAANVLDLGSGTGILAIAAVRLGAGWAVCVDPDPGAVATARRNAELNGLSERIAHVHGTLAAVAERPFDLAVANLYGEVLWAQADALVARVAPDGWLLLSGILWQDQFPVEQRYQRLGCEIRRTWMLEEYCSLVLRKTSAP